MKKLFFSLSAILVCFLLSCAGKGTGGKMSAQAQKNLDGANAINAAIQSGDVSKLDQYIAADGVDHTGSKGEVKGVDAIKAELGSMHTSSDDMKLEVTTESANDDYTFQWIRYTGTSKTADMGMPPGTKFDMNSVEVLKWKDGKATDHWGFMQPNDVMKMMQQPQQGGMENKMDTTTHK